MCLASPSSQLEVIDTDQINTLLENQYFSYTTRYITDVLRIYQMKQYYSFLFKLYSITSNFDGQLKVEVLQQKNVWLCQMNQ